MSNQSSDQKRRQIVLRLLLSLFVVGICAFEVLGVSADDYLQNLKRAVTALDTLSQREEEESDASYDQRVKQTVASIRSALRPIQTVQFGDQNCEVNNDWLFDGLNEIERVNANNRPDKLLQLLQRIKALEEGVTAFQTATTVTESKGEAKEKLATILKRSEYDSGARGENAVKRLLIDFLRWIQSWMPKIQPVAPGRAKWFTFIAQVLFVILASAVVTYVLFTLFKWLRFSKKPKTKKVSEPRIVLGERLEPEESAGDLLTEAEALALKGELRAAIRKAYIALLVELGDRKIVSLSQDKTNRDYLRSVRNIPLLHTRMTGLTDRFERHWYGFAKATPDDWQQFREEYKSALQGKG